MRRRLFALGKRDAGSDAPAKVFPSQTSTSWRWRTPACIL